MKCDGLGSLLFKAFRTRYLSWWLGGKVINLPNPAGGWIARELHELELGKENNG